MASTRRLSASKTQDSFGPGNVWDSGTKNGYDPFHVLRNRAIQEHKAAHEESIERPEEIAMGIERKKQGFTFW